LLSPGVPEMPGHNSSTNDVTNTPITEKPTVEQLHDHYVAACPLCGGTAFELQLDPVTPELEAIARVMCFDSDCEFEWHSTQ